MISKKRGGKIKVGTCNSEEIFENFEYSTTRKTSFIFYQKSSYNQESKTKHSAFGNKEFQEYSFRIILQFSKSEDNFIQTDIVILIKLLTKAKIYSLYRI